MFRTPSRARARAAGRGRQRGFTLIEVMVASVILSVFVLGLSGLWQASSRRVEDLTVRQKAVFVLNAEMERLTALYGYTSFGDGGATTSTGYNDNSVLPASRLVYPDGGTLLSIILGGPGQNFVTTSFNTFRTGPEFRVFVVDSGLLGTSDRAYVWIDRERNVAGRLSWVTSEISVNSCEGGDNCSCHDFDGTDSWLFKRNCRTLELFLEYPYRPTSTGAFVTPANVRTMSLRTIVGRL